VARDRDEDTGKYQLVYDDEDLLQGLTGTRLSTKEVAEELCCHRTTAHERLREMENDGKVKSSPAGNTLIWEIN